MKMFWNYCQNLCLFFFILKWLLEVKKQLNDDIYKLKQLWALIYSQEEKHIDKLQEIQNEIYNHRKWRYMILDFFYKLYKSKDEGMARKLNE